MTEADKTKHLNTLAAAERAQVENLSSLAGIYWNHILAGQSHAEAWQALNQFEALKT